MTTAQALPALRVVWRHEWQHVAAHKAPPVYVVQSHASYRCPCGSDYCTSPYERCPNGKYGTFNVTRKTHLVSLSPDAAKQCARDALRAMLADEHVSYPRAGLEEGGRLPDWLAENYCCAVGEALLRLVRAAWHRAHGPALRVLRHGVQNAAGRRMQGAAAPLRAHARTQRFTAWDHARLSRSRTRCTACELHPVASHMSRTALLASIDVQAAFAHASTASVSVLMCVCAYVLQYGTARAPW